MSRALITVHSEQDRQRAAHWASKSPTGTRIEFKASKRTLPQNDKMWAMLTDVARQKNHAGRRLSPDRWKDIFMHALGQEVEFVPSLDGADVIALGYRSSDLGKHEMADLIELMLSWGAENGIVWSDPTMGPTQ